VKACAKQFALIFFLGFIALAAALGYGSATGHLLSGHPFVAALRFFGLGFMAAGLVLWIALRRDQAGRPGLNTFLGLMIGVGSLLLLVGLLFPLSDLSVLLGPSGLAFNLAALLVGFLAVLFAPAYPRPVVKRWEEAPPVEAEVHTNDTHAADEQAAG
jgi:hypothetical protein